MCRAVSESLTVSTDMAAAAGLGVLSVACNKYGVALKDGWFQPLTLYMVICAEAGEKKSPVLNAMKKPLDDWSKQRNIDLKGEIAESKQKYRNMKNLLKRAEKDAENGKDGAEEETLRLAREIDAFESVRPVRLYSGDVTSEKLVQLLSDNGERFAILSSEGGILQVLSGDRYGNGTANYDIYCQGYNGETVNVDRINSGTVTMENPVLSMTLFVQPVILAGLLGNETLQGVGLCDRCLYAAPISTIGKERFDAIPIPGNVEAGYSNMIRRLLEGRERTLWLSDEAREQFAGYYNRFTKDIPFAYEDLKGWASKFRGTVGRIAGILQLCEDADSGRISGDNMMRAIILSDYFTEQARLILREGGMNQNEQTAKYLLDRVRALRDKTYADEAGRIVLKYRDLRANVNKRGLKQKADYDEPLQCLIDKGWIDVNAEVFAQVTELYINPAVWG